MKPLRDDRGRRDSHGYKLRASVEAVADELACAAGLVCGKLNRAPACIVRGFRYEPGSGKVGDLLRPASPIYFAETPALSPKLPRAFPRIFRYTVETLLATSLPTPADLPLQAKT